MVESQNTSSKTPEKRHMARSAASLAAFLLLLLISILTAEKNSENLNIAIFALAIAIPTSLSAAICYQEIERGATGLSDHGLVQKLAGILNFFAVVSAVVSTGFVIAHLNVLAGRLFGLIFVVLSVLVMTVIDRDK